ncbi:hypothetical protein QGP82_00760 [Leptothoe sp. LEGE 181152]|nr:hypothetical protein [Leptothoe sp. LEGE 181152]
MPLQDCPFLIGFWVRPDRSALARSHPKSQQANSAVQAYSKPGSPPDLEPLGSSHCHAANQIQPLEPRPRNPMAARRCKLGTNLLTYPPLEHGFNR